MRPPRFLTFHTPFERWCERRHISPLRVKIGIVLLPPVLVLATFAQLGEWSEAALRWLYRRLPS